MKIPKILVFCESWKTIFLTNILNNGYTVSCHSPVSFSFTRCFKMQPLKHLHARASIFVTERLLRVTEFWSGTCSTDQRSSYSRDHVRKPPLSSCRNQPFRQILEKDSSPFSFITLKEIPLAMKTVPESGETGPISSSTLRGSRSLISWSWISSSSTFFSSYS